jgi:hypothetical protein
MHRDSIVTVTCTLDNFRAYPAIEIYISVIYEMNIKET